MKIKYISVHHAKEPTFRLDSLTLARDFRQVARVATDDLEVAFELTNTINGPWWLNDRVTFLGTGGCRSTSVGDMMVAWNSEGGYTVHRVDGCGFVDVTGSIS